MTHTELRAAIQEIIRKITGCEINCTIHIKDIIEEGLVVGYEVGFEDHQYLPTWYSATLPDNEFLKFLEEQLRHAAFLTTKRFSTSRNTTRFKQNPFIL